MFAIKSGNQYLQDILGGNGNGPKVVWDDKNIRVYPDSIKSKNEMWADFKTLTTMGYKAQVVQLVEQPR